MKKKTQAFTLLELMIVVALIAIVTAYGLPRLKGFTTNTGLISNTNALVAALQYARSSAINDQGRVVICTSDNAMTGAPTCGGAATLWHEGWIIFRDTDNNATFGSGDVLLRAQAKVAIAGITITPVALGGNPTNIVDYVSFGPPAGEPMLANGLNQSGLFRICSAADTTKVRGVTLHFSGRISATRNVTSPCP